MTQKLHSKSPRFGCQPCTFFSPSIAKSFAFSARTCASLLFFYQSFALHHSSYFAVSDLCTWSHFWNDFQFFFLLANSKFPISTLPISDFCTFFQLFLSDLRTFFHITISYTVTPSFRSFAIRFPSIFVFFLRSKDTPFRPTPFSLDHSTSWNFRFPPSYSCEFADSYIL